MHLAARFGQRLWRLHCMARTTAEWSDAAVASLRAGGPKGLWLRARAFARRRDVARLRCAVQGRPLFPATLPAGWENSFSGVREAMAHFGSREIQALRDSGGTLDFPDPGRPVVSIVVPMHGNAAYTYFCLRSLLENTGGAPYEVIAVDDASRDGTADLLSLTRYVRVLRHAENRGFAAACNGGAALARGKYLCFLNNDALVTPSWLAHLVRTAESWPDCGAVGAQLVKPGGALQEAGSIVWRDGSALGYGRGDDPARPEYQHVREVDFCSGACLLVDRSLFERLGGFDEDYRRAYYEDVALCFKVREAGRRVVYQPAVVVYHLEYGSTGESAVRQMRNNRQVFARRWQHRLGDYAEASPFNVFGARDARRGRRVFVVDDRIPTPPYGSGYPRAYGLLLTLARLGFVVSYFPLRDSRPHQPWLERLQQLGVEVFCHPHDSFIELLRQRAGCYDAAIVSRPHNAARALPALRKYWPDVPVIYDAEALYGARTVLEAKLRGAELSPSQVQSIVAAEMAVLTGADAVMTVSESERQAFSLYLGDRPAVVWSHALEAVPPRRGFDDRGGMLFVGGFPAARSPNELAVGYLVREVLPLLRGRLDAGLVVVGADPPEPVRELAGANIEVAGFVDDLGSLYEGRRVFVAPHQIAAGISLKVLEAMSRGMPCVVSDLIAGQLGLTHGVEALVGGSPAELAAGIVEAHEDRGTWERLQLGALAFIRRACDPEVLGRRLEEVIESAVARRRRLSERPSRATVPAKSPRFVGSPVVGDGGARIPRGGG